MSQEEENHCRPSDYANLNNITPTVESHLVQVDKAQLDELITQNQDLKALCGEQLADLHTIAKSLQGLKSLISTNGISMKNILSLTTKLASGQLKLEGMEEMMRVADKYKIDQDHGKTTQLIN